MSLSETFRLAAECDEHDEGIGEILQASDDIARYDPTPGLKLTIVAIRILSWGTFYCMLPGRCGVSW